VTIALQITGITVDGPYCVFIVDGNNSLLLFATKVTAHLTYNCETGTLSWFGGQVWFPARAVYSSFFGMIQQSCPLFVKSLLYVVPQPWNLSIAILLHVPLPGVWCTPKFFSLYNLLWKKIIINVYTWIRERIIFVFYRVVCFSEVSVWNKGWGPFPVRARRRPAQTGSGSHSTCSVGTEAEREADYSLPFSAHAVLEWNMLG
jgi:hypothetical protein